MTRAAVGKVIDLWQRVHEGGPCERQDEELLRQFAEKRDEAAFSALLRRHGPMVWGVCQRLLYHRQDAEDAFQATFVVLAKRAHAVVRRKLLGNWLFGVARRVSLALRRQRTQRSLRELLLGEVPEVHASTAATWNEVNGVLDEELARLPSKYRQPLLLCCLQGLSHDEASKTLKWPIGTVAGRLSRGRQMLRLRLRQRGLVVSSALLTAVMAPDVLASTVPPLLVSTVIQNALSVANKGLAGTALSGAVLGVTQELLQKMALIRAAAIFAGLTLAFVLLGGAGLLWDQMTVQPSNQAALDRSFHPELSVPWPEVNALVAEPIRLPENPNAVVLQLQLTNQQQDKPSNMLTIHADGRVVAETAQTVDGSRQTRKYEDRLSATQLQDLVGFIVLQQELFDFQYDKVMQSLQEEFEFDGTLNSPYDTVSTQISVCTADRFHKVDWHQLGSAGVYFRDVEKINQLIAVERRLHNLLCILQAGGQTQVTGVADQLNRELRKTYPNGRPMTVADLVGFSDFDTSRRYTFSHGNKYRGPDYFSVTLEIAQEGPGRITQLTPGPSQNPPTLKRREWPLPRCLEEDPFFTG